jgi:hypothetical protein
MTFRIAALLPAIVLCGPAVAATVTVPDPGLGAVTLPAARDALKAAGRVADNATLAAAATSAFPAGVWRDDYASGNGAPPLFFTAQTGTCAANSMADDGGSCVDGAGGNSWKARHGASGYDVRQWGAKCDGATNDTTAIQAAFAAKGNAKYILPEGTCIAAGLVAPENNYTLEGAGGRDATTLKLADGANTYLLASYRYANNIANSELGPEIHGITFDGNKANQTSDTACIILRTRRAYIHGNTVTQCSLHGVLLTAPAADGVTSVASMPNNLFQANNFTNNDGAGLYGDDLGNILNDQYVKNNVFNANGTLGYYNIQTEQSAGWMVTGNKLFSSPKGEISLVGCGGTTVNDNNIDGDTNVADGTDILTVTITCSGFGYLTFSGNEVKNNAVSLGTATSAILVDIAQGSATGAAVVTGNTFLALNTAVTSINYHGSQAATNPLVVGPNGYSPLVAPPTLSQKIISGMVAFVSKGYLVSALPATAVAGTRVHVTDAVSCTFGATPTGGGSVFCPVVRTDAAWVAG